MSGSQSSDQRFVESLPGYRRVLRVEPEDGAVTAYLEDDLHCMAVRLRHDGSSVLKVEPLMDRVPWSVCPGAAAALVETFEGVLLSGVTSRRERTANCTHLHDLAILGAAHALDAEALEYHVFVSDPYDDEGEPRRDMEIRRGERILHRWTERSRVFVEPQSLAGLSPMTMRDWVAGQQGEALEAARLLQWASLIAHGRVMTDEQRRQALGVRPNCFTMQPDRVGEARMKTGMHDFSRGGPRPLDGLKERFAAQVGS